MRGVRPWLALGAATAALGWALGAIGLPSQYLFGALVIGMAVALARPSQLALPSWAYLSAQAVAGVTLGTYLRAASLRALGHAWLPVLIVSAATVGVSLAVGLVLARVTSLDRPTAALGMIAGGASGIVPIARELHGDDRLVAFMQYARVLMVVLLTPTLSPLLFPGHHFGGGAMGTIGGPALGDAPAWPATAALAAAGAFAGRRLGVSGGTLLGPMILTGVLTLTGVTDALTVPPVLLQVALGAIGLQVGLRFTRATVRQVGRLLLPVVAAVIALLVGCFGLAALLAATTPASLLDAYLATTPGGLYAVLAVAFGAGANTTFIVAVQGLRVLVMVLLAPLAVRRLLGRLAAA